jgi:maltose phosphorylase
MKKYLQIHPWKVIEDGFDAANVEASESIFSLGNGKMGQRANFEEQYSGHSLQGNYFAGIFYPDKTRVGWWKIGYPEYFGKMINSVNWVGIDVYLDDEPLDLAKCQVFQFRRELDMKEGTLSRSFYAELPSGKMVQVHAKRFISMANTRLAAIQYSITAVNFKGTITLVPYLDGDVKNRDANYNEKFWDEVSKTSAENKAALIVKTKKLDYHVGSGMTIVLHKNNQPVAIASEKIERIKYIGLRYTVAVESNQTLTIYKYVCNVTSLDVDPGEMFKVIDPELENAVQTGYDKLLDLHRQVWESKWERSDIVIEGDDEAQQGIRFNIFQLNQTYTGDDERLNIGPKGFTGEKYGGGTYWDTEAFCFPFYLCTANQNVARNLLLYRYRQLDKAIENARKLGFTDGAALYPMVTVNGEECHNEWEITFEEIHRNGAIAYAIYNYVKHTGDKDYLAHYGLEVLIALSRFWSQRVNFSKPKGKFVILGVTGPNEYENNVNNNWYTNFMARWTLEYTLETIGFVRENHPKIYEQLTQKINFREKPETERWKNIIENIYLPVIEGTNIFLQQEGFLDKEIQTVDAIPKNQRPINQHWSWDRILRSCFIKQADVLQGIYFFLDKFSMKEVEDNFNYYEPMTVHESSLSPSIHSVVASHINNVDKAYELYLRTSRLDLDDYNHEVKEGLHITSMAGSWLAIVEGFARKRIVNGKLSFEPLIVPKWKSYNFKIQYRGQIVELQVNNEEVVIVNHSASPLEIYLYGTLYTIAENGMLHYKKQIENLNVRVSSGR